MRTGSGNGPDLRFNLTGSTPPPSASKPQASVTSPEHRGPSLASMRAAGGTCVEPRAPRPARGIDRSPASTTSKTHLESNRGRTARRVGAANGNTQIRLPVRIRPGRVKRTPRRVPNTCFRPSSVHAQPRQRTAGMRASTPGPTNPPTRGRSPMIGRPPDSSTVEERQTRSRPLAHATGLSTPGGPKDAGRGRYVGSPALPPCRFVGASSVTSHPSRYPSPSLADRASTRTSISVDVSVASTPAADDASQSGSTGQSTA